MNQLNGQTSPYLLQHANNPVHWHPWNEQALQLARKENKPILLSIGYSACHWCHVMAHESFENDKTAEVMNALFINIKVDREERPDLDKIYQLSYQIMAQRAGGWPLTMFLTPDDHTPFFAGTYFPKQAQYNLPGFVDVLHHVTHLYHEQYEKITRHQDDFSHTLRRITQSDSANEINYSVIKQAQFNLTVNFDSVHGGFGQAPKFPQPTALEFLLNCGPESSDIPLMTLEKMAEGGIYDHLGGGFFRYSVDERWEIPHFEKMLYDNAQLLTLYAYAWQKTKKPIFEHITLTTADWVIREMQAPEGGYYSSYDADSEGIEGKFYVWQKSQLQDLLTDQEYCIFTQHFGLDQAANFESFWHLSIKTAIPALAVLTKLSIEHTEQLLDSAKTKLLAIRNQRVPPGRDDKVLVSWNALMIKAMSIAGRIFNRSDYIESAKKSVTFIQSHMYQNQRLLATAKDGHAHLNAYLDDYSFMTDALLELNQCRWNSDYYDWAVLLADSILEYFEDSAKGGFYFTTHDHERLVYRPKPMSDEALPSGNAIAVKTLLMLDSLQTNQRYAAAAKSTFFSTMNAICRQPEIHCAMLNSLINFETPVSVISIHGQNQHQWLNQLQQNLSGPYTCFALPEDARNLPMALQHKTEAGQTSAYICDQNGCSTAILSLKELTERLSEN